MILFGSQGAERLVYMTNIVSICFLHGIKSSRTSLRYVIRIDLLVDNREWYPDGYEALLGYKEASVRVFQCLKVLDSTWKDQLELCEGCITALDDEKDAVDHMVKALDFSEKWIGYQKDIEKARLSIDKICDVIPIKATGAPRQSSAHSSHGRQHEGGDARYASGEEFKWPEAVKFFKSTTTQFHTSMGRMVSNGIKGFDTLLLGPEDPNPGTATSTYPREQGSRVAGYNGAGGGLRDRGRPTRDENPEQTHNAYDQFNMFAVPGAYPH
ncbi:hypothetical protein CPB86DRAFT_210998 [Serendipita vermifera]|nr:hypothetical protein CPB86DRAFT_210998 [Serendipita vermifera]